MWTEDQAKLLACPIYAVVAALKVNSPGIKIGQNVHAERPPEGRCMASGCMMWREGPPECEWRSLESFLAAMPEPFKWDKNLADRAGDAAKAAGFNYSGGVVIYGHPIKVGKFVATRGYCGLATDTSVNPPTVVK